MTKKLLTLALISLLFLVFCTTANAETVASGTCGENLTWTLDDVGTLTISGTGEMTNWSDSMDQPWQEYKASIQAVVVENGVISIGNFSFYDCNNLSSVSLPDSLTTICLSPFGNCSNLTEISIPKNVTEIGNDFQNNFNDCTKLIAIHVADDNPNYTSVDGVLFTKNKDRLLDYPCNSPNTSFTIPQTVKYIAEGAFQYSNLTEILVDPNNRYYASENGVLLNSSKTNLIVYPHSNTQTTYTIPSSVTLISVSAFKGSKNLVEILIPDSVTTIEASAFSGCNKLSSITFPSSVVNIGSGLFENCGNLKSVTLSTGITEITYSMFYDCIQLQDVIIPNGIATISDFAFKGCTSLTSIILPNTVTSIGIGSFQGCTNLNQISLSNNLIEISTQAFRSCSSLKKVTLPSSITTLGISAFSGCTSLQEITIPSSVTQILRGAFLSCYNLQTVYFNGSKAEWDEIVIGSYNDPLLNATIIYQSISDFYFTDFTTTSNGFAITANLSSQLKEKDGIILFAVYHDNCLKRFVPFSAAESVTHNFTSLASGEYTIKAFYWSDLANIQPLCAPAEKTFSL